MQKRILHTCRRLRLLLLSGQFCSTGGLESWPNIPAHPSRNLNIDAGKRTIYRVGNKVCSAALQSGKGKLTSMAAASAALGTTRKRRDLAGMLSGSIGVSSSMCMRGCEALLLQKASLLKHRLTGPGFRSNKDRSCARQPCAGGYCRNMRSV